ncbi:MAG: hypothetical protein WCW56_01960 [Candidatus Paceibacterota bacterium]|jgi:hypothetical protein
MSAKKKIGLAVFFLIAIAILVFWYVGSNYREKNRLVQQKHYADILQKEARLQSLVAQAIGTSSSTLEDFDLASLPKRLTAKNLKTVPTSSSTLASYTLIMAKIIQPFGAERENEAEIMLRALDQQSEMEAQKILLSKDLYDQAINQLTNTKVPTEAVNLHLKMTNNLREMSMLSANMINILRNPVLALESADIFRQKKIIFYTTISEINSYLGRKGVKLDEEKKVDIYINL